MLLTLAGLALLGCGAVDSGVGGEELRSDKQRVTKPNVAQGDLSRQVAGNTEFAFDLYQRLRDKPDNIFFSPYSITIAMAMVHGGAHMNTEQQSADTMHFELPQSSLHPVFNKLDLELNSRGQGSKAADGKAFRLNVVNAVWGQRNYSFLPAYLDTLALNYGAGLRVVDFESAPDPSRIEINEWVERQTEGRIQDLLPPDSVSSDTRMVLTNAIYFNAAWAKAFDKDATRDGPFSLLDGKQVTVPMMAAEVDASYVKDADFVAAALPYDGRELSMLVIVPDDLKSFEATLTGEKVRKIAAQLQPSSVAVKLPSFELEMDLSLKEHLVALGMKDAFNPIAADLSGMTSAEQLYISAAVHKAFVKVNEAGTEAAAATAVVVAPSAAPPTPVKFIADRPFIFVIRDHQTGAVLFVGRVLDPR